jgi:hypothetical protein
VDATAHYRQLAQLGRAQFLAAAAPAVLLRKRGPTPPPDFEGLETGTYDEPHMPGEAPEVVGDDFDIIPLVKKPNASFGDRITVGRIANNDVVLGHHTVSRLHVYFKHRDGAWYVADAGSKNGTSLRDEELIARKEMPIAAGDHLWIGDVELVFETATSLYPLLGGK